VKRAVALGFILGLISIGCGSDDTRPQVDLGQDQNPPTDMPVPDLDTSDMETPDPDMPAEDMPAEDMPAEDMPAEDMPAEDMPPEDMPEDAEPDLPPVDSTCLNAMDVTAGGVFENQTTVGAGENYDALPNGMNCPNGRFSGPDRVYVVEPAVQTNYTVRVVPVGNFDPFIYVRTDCSATACVAGTVLNGAGEPESLTFNAVGGVKSFVIVDGELGSEGAYQLTVTIN